MKINFQFLLLISLFQLSLHNIVDLTDDNFNDIVMKSEDIWFIKFYSFSCEHCKKFAPVFIELAQSDLKVTIFRKIILG